MLRVFLLPELLVWLGAIWFDAGGRPVGGADLQLPAISLRGADGSSPLFPGALTGPLTAYAHHPPHSAACWRQLRQLRRATQLDPALAMRA